MKNLFLFIVLFLMNLGCDSPVEVKPPLNRWESIHQLANMNVLDIKILNGELIIAGIQDSHGVAYKSEDGIVWTLITPLENCFFNGICSIDYWKGDIIGVAPGLPICILSRDTLIPISAPWYVPQNVDSKLSNFRFNFFLLQNKFNWA